MTPRVLDGAMGTLLAPHLAAGRCESVELLCVHEPRHVLAAHGAYLAAGATSLQTNTFLAFTLPDRIRREVLLAGLELAREAIAERRARACSAATDDIELLATLGPDDDPRRLRGDIELLLGRGEARSVLVETITNPAAARELLAAWHDVAGSLDGAELTLSCSIDPATEPAGRSCWPGSIDLPAGVTLGLNCCAGPSGLADVLAELADSTRSSLHVAPSAGLPAVEPDDPDGVTSPTWPWASPGSWAAAVVRSIDGIPIRRVGGCCGTTPAHVEALQRVLAAR